jgi:hypothetical protein
MEIDMHDFIENEAAYEAATERRIANNRRIGGERRFRGDGAVARLGGKHFLDLQLAHREGNHHGQCQETYA